MWCPEELKLNKYEHVAIPSNAEYFLRNGEVRPNPQSFTGDDTPRQFTNVGEQMKDMEKWMHSVQAQEAARQQEEERKKLEVEADD